MRIIWFFLAVVLIGLFIAYRVVISDFEESFFQQKQSILFYDDQGTLFYSLSQGEGRQYVPLSDISKDMLKATLAIEDARFFQHFGFDVPRTLFAAWQWLRSGAPKAGASTLTQQLAKLHIVGSKKTLFRKTIELFASIFLEIRYSKKEILEMYLNSVYLGKNSYGVETAARNYFQKSAKDLTLNEASLLAALIQRPSGYDLTVDAEDLAKRQEVVLKRLYELGWIEKEEYLTAFKTPVKVYGTKKKSNDPYWVFFLLQNLRATYGAALIDGGGVKVYTTLNRRAQDMMESSLEQLIAAKSLAPDQQIAGIALESKTGRVIAMLGGVDFELSQFNRATQAKRQVGSAIKPFLYALALDKGLKPWDRINDDPEAYPKNASAEEFLGTTGYYEPKNFKEEYLGEVPLAYALQQSNNIVSVKLLHILSVRDFASFTAQFGLNLDSQKGLCLALGCQEVSLVDLVSAYSAFSNEGSRCAAHFLREVVTTKGEVLEREKTACQPTVKREVAIELSSILKNTVDLGTARAAKLPFPVAGKTGTTNSFRDAWFVGYDQSITAGFWLGKDDNSPMQDEVGGGKPARLWKGFMEKAAELYPPDLNFAPSGFKKVDFCYNFGIALGDIQQVRYPLWIPADEIALDPCPP